MARSVHAARFALARAAMADLGVDALLLSVGPELPWLCGYEAMPLERLTMLVVPREGDATLVVPRLEAPRVVERPELFALRPWDETEDPIEVVAELLGPVRNAAIGDRTWVRFLVDLQRLAPAAQFRRASEIVGPLRAVKDDAEIEQLRLAAAAADRVAAQLQRGDVPLVGRTEAEVSAEIGQRLLAEGHRRVNFAIVAVGSNAASPHHEPSTRTIGTGEVVLCDFGGTWPSPDGAGYCSDITRCVWTGTREPPAELVDLYSVLRAAHAAGVDAAKVGTRCDAVDAAARDVIIEAGHGPDFFHRTGHGIGIEEHEDPYIVSGNTEPLVSGNAFSIEPGIYVEGHWGIRLEDIVVATPAGAEPLNHVDHDLLVVDA